MSKERELLQRLVSAELNDIFDLLVEAQQLLAQPEQEPVAWQYRTFHSEHTVCPRWAVWEYCTESKFNNVGELVTTGFYQVRKLYKTPPKREPVCYWASDSDAEKAHSIRSFDDE
jgi:hypothetical protein